MAPNTLDADGRTRSVYLQKEDLDSLRKIAIADDRSVNYLVRIAIQEYLARHASERTVAPDKK